MCASTGEPLVIAELQDAIVLARVLAYWNPECLTLVVLDDDQAVIDAIPISDTVEVEEIAEIVVTIPNDQGRRRVAEVLYITADPPSGEVLAEDDIVTWHRVRRLHERDGPAVFDWLIVSGDTVRSMAETTGDGWSGCR